MMRFIMPIILIIISVTVFFLFTNGIYTEIGDLNKTVASYDTALNNARSLKEE
jgi:hypothetical protein